MTDGRPTIGPYEGGIVQALDGPELRAALADLPRRIAGAEALQDGRNRTVRWRVRLDGRDLDLAVKSFGCPSGIAGFLAARRMSKARRSWLAARRLAESDAGTPAPVGWLDRHEGGRRVESHWITEFNAGLSTFRDELVSVYRERPRCDELMDLLQVVADAVRAMHAAGVQHNDLGNQNILLRREAPGRWSDVRFIDLNRAKLRDPMTNRRRARDLSRISLPSDFRRIFYDMVFDGPPPRDFVRWERHYRLRFALHTQTRRWRHPIRERGAARTDVVPPARDIWIWDERSGQAISVWVSRDRHRLRDPRDGGAIALALARDLPAAYAPYRKMMASAFAATVDMRNRVGVAVQPRPETEERETGLLRRLGPIPVLVRFYHHETEREWAYTAGAVKRLRAAGHPVTVALVQDRRAVLDPARWRSFLEGVIGSVSGDVDAVEIGHAVNRVKWGLWSLADYRALMAPAAEVMARHPRLDWLGPAAIDFEYHRVPAFLRTLPDGARLSAMSHHLYVDRRGAPENRQAGWFGLLEKAALARALAAASGRCGDRLVISEVNWPLAGTGVWSPVCSPHLYPGRTVETNVGEDAYARYMIRYLLIALCSGMAERVFWWRLAAHGYGLVDDRAPGGWRPRPAYEALRRFLEDFGDARFSGLAKDAPSGARVFLFDSAGRRRAIAYAHPSPVEWTPPFAPDAPRDLHGRTIEFPPGPIRLTGTPIIL